MKKHCIEILIAEQKIKARIAELGKQISDDYQGADNGVILVGLLRGSFIFMADLSRAITVSHEVDFMAVSSYGDVMQSSQNVKILKDLDEQIGGKDILIIEDIIDTGYTLSKVRSLLEARQPNKIKICTLLDKPSRREVDIEIDYIGFTIPDEFVVGYGIDYAQRYRHLPYIGKVRLLDSKL